jgi:beta-lactam-binding protein with PASTA domain
MLFPKIIRFFKHVSFLIPFVGFIFGYSFVCLYLQTKTEVSPNLVGKNVQEAIYILSKKNLGLKLLREKEDSLLPEGTVINQIPFPNQKVKCNQSLLVTLSKKPPTKFAPNLFGKTSTKMLEELADLQVTGKMIQIKSNEKNNTIIAQSPPAGGEITEQKMILYLSQEKEALFLVPNFKGQDLKQVKEYLHRMNIKCETFDPMFLVVEKHGEFDFKIVNQQPIPGTIVDLRKELRMQLEVLIADASF